MKKLLLVTVLAMVLAFALVSAASANGGPHGGYTATTDACAGCHRAHTASGPKLLIDTDTTALCLSCHGAAANGADTNVEDGVFLSTRNASSTWGEANTADNAPLLGGGFVNYQGANVTSSHSVTGTVTAAWGNGVARGTTADLATALNCASCHDPHGSANYRIIKEVVNNVAVSVAQVDEGIANKDYDTEQWSTGQSNVCAACHSDYHKTAAGQGSTLDGASYTHRIDMPFNYGTNVNPETVGVTEGATTYTLPLAETGTNNTVVCQTCHLPHGTSASMAGFAVGASAAGDSALLRLDNRGVCEVCHQK